MARRPFTMLALVTVPALLALLATGRPLAAAPGAEVPEARRVVVRGHRDLAAAIAAATGGREEGVCAVVLDVTPHVRAARPLLEDALMQLGTRRAVPRRWRIARLGERFSEEVPDAARLARQLPALLAEDTPVDDTLGALTRTVADLPRGPGCVVYLADWRFEDAHDLRGLLGALKTRGLGFGVVGSEAGFGRGWHDGIADARRRLAAGPDAEPYVAGIGRRPFGPFDPQAPWHGGDLAAPHAPYRFAADLWRTEFSPSDLRFAEDGVLDLGQLGGRPRGLEDLAERLGGNLERPTESIGASMFTRVPLPAAFGPHALMRAAGLRGGRYVLWSWNPEHRVSIRYEPARCDAFGPDLRDRATIRREAPRRPAHAAMLKAWQRLVERRSAVVIHTPPLGPGARGPRSIDLVPEDTTRLPTTWCERAEHAAFLDRATDWLAAVAAAREDLARGLARAAKDDGPAAARLEADARLFDHALAVLHFELAEALAAARTVRPDDFGPEHCLVLRAIPWIQRGDDPDAVRTTDATPHDAEAGRALREARREHLRRYRGTPFGLQVAANTVDTWRVERRPRMRPTPGQPTPRAPAESGGETPDTPRAPGGPSGGGGPATGGGR